MIREIMRSNTAFIDSQLMFAALRLFCKHGAKDRLSKPFWDVANGHVYACNGPCAIRVWTNVRPLEGEIDERGAAKKFDELHKRACKRIESVEFLDLYRAAEVAIAICRERYGEQNELWVDDHSERAYVSIPGVGVFRADFIVDAMRALSIMDTLGICMYVHGRENDCPEGVKISTYCDDVVIFVCCLGFEGVIERDSVVVEAGSLRELYEREIGRICEVSR